MSSSNTRGKREIPGLEGFKNCIPRSSKKGKERGSKSLR